MCKTMTPTSKDGKTPSAQQQAIFDWFADSDGHLIIRARAGTGKTTTIVWALDYARELQNNIGRPRVFIGAYNTKIAEELTARTRGRNVVCRTFHGIGYRYILSQWPGTKIDHKRGRRLALAAAGPDAPGDMVRLVAKLASVGKNSAPEGGIDDLVRLAKEFDCEPDESWQDDGWTTRKIATIAADAMRLAQRRDGTIDFDDQIYLPVALRFARPDFSLVIIDEAQDMNRCRLRLALRMCNIKNGGRVVVVGDDRQAIYGFCGAHSGALDDLKAALKAKELPLSVTYRCGKQIVKEAQRLVPDYQAAPNAHEGEVSAIGQAQLYEAAQPGDAILSRLNAPLAGVCLRLLRLGKRARVEGKKIGEDLKYTIEKFKARSWADFLSKLEGWKARELEKAAIKARAGDDKAAETLRDKIEDEYATIMVLTDGLRSVAALIRRIEELFSDTEAGSLPAIVCSSIHRSKGLEWKVVYVLDWTLYSRSPTADQREEANLEYVAITRAMNRFVRVSRDARSTPTGAPAALSDHKDSGVRVRRRGSRPRPMADDFEGIDGMDVANLWAQD